MSNMYMHIINHYPKPKDGEVKVESMLALLFVRVQRI